MPSLFTFKRKNAFRLYSLLFIAVVFIERYFVHEIISNCYTTYNPAFFSHNYLRLLALFLPFCYVIFFQQKKGLEPFVSNLPFLFLSCTILALPFFQIFYVTLFLINCALIKDLRIIPKIAAVIISVWGFLHFVVYFTVAPLYFIPFIAAFIFIKRTHIFFKGIALLTGCFSILVSTNLPNRGCCTAKTTRVRSNAHTFQTVLETYAVDWNGQYPESSTQLKAVALAGNYWKDFKNPFTDKSGYGISFRDTSAPELLRLRVLTKKSKNKLPSLQIQPDLFGIRLHQIKYEPKQKGVILYNRVNSGLYFIYGIRDSSNALILSRGIPFTLTNS